VRFLGVYRKCSLPSPPDSNEIGLTISDVASSPPSTSRILTEGETPQSPCAAGRTLRVIAVDPTPLPSGRGKNSLPIVRARQTDRSPSFPEPQRASASKGSGTPPTPMCEPLLGGASADRPHLWWPVVAREDGPPTSPIIARLHCRQGVSLVEHHAQ